MSTGNRTVSTTTEAGSRALLLFDSDGRTFLVDNKANTYVCSDSRLFIGPLIDFNVSLDTVNGKQGNILKTGTICISWEDDSGETLSYDFQDIVYNPSSSFNIMSVGGFGQHFGSIDSPPTNNE